MSIRKELLKYVLAAVILATLVIAGVVFFFPVLTPTTPVEAQPVNFVVMLTDPPTVPAGTTMLNLSYSEISIHVTYPSNTTQWLNVTGNGTVNAFSLINVTQTIANITLPNGTIVDKIQFTISQIQAQINGTVYPVTALSNLLTVSIANSQRLNQTQSGVLLDLNPTLVQIQATNAEGGTDSYYVLVPGATAVYVNSVNQNQVKVGTIVELQQNDREKLIRVVEGFRAKVSIDSASLSSSGNITNFSMTLSNKGNSDATVFGVTLNGQFNVSGLPRASNGKDKEISRPDSLPFRINGTSLVPLPGLSENEGDNEGIGKVSRLTLSPGQSVTLSFSGVISLSLGHDGKGKAPLQPIIVTPASGLTYTIRLTGEGFQTFEVKAF